MASVNPAVRNDSCNDAPSSPLPRIVRDDTNLESVCIARLPLVDAQGAPAAAGPPRAIGIAPQFHPPVILDKHELILLKFVEHPDLKNHIGRAAAKSARALVESHPMPSLDLSNLGDQIFHEKREVHYVKISAEDEKVLFLGMNVWKQRAHAAYAELSRTEQEVPSHSQRQNLISELSTGLTHAKLIRDFLINNNLALIAAMARRRPMFSDLLTESVSRASETIIKCVDLFDVSRGWKFSTYACRSIITAFRRESATFLKHHATRETNPLVQEDILENVRDERDHIRGRIEAESCRERDADLAAALNELDENEFTVLKLRFGLDGKVEKLSSLLEARTLEQVGDIIGISKERVRQIQNKALGKLREYFGLYGEGSERHGEATRKSSA